MIRHIVLVKFDPATPEAERSAVLADLEGLSAFIPGMSGFSASANVSPENLDRGFNHAFSIDFADEASRDAYLVHPRHQAAGGRLVKAAAGGIEGLLVFDMAC